MKKLLAYLLSIVYYPLFGITLALFQVIQWFCFTLFGYSAHKKSVDALCFFLTLNTYILGTRYKIKNRELLPVGVPLIVVANHQSWYDITTIGWFLRKIHPKYVSKIELGKGLPSISYNLRNGGSVLIDRKDPKQSLAAIRRLAEYIEKYQRTAVIFPEGTRTNSNKPLPFAESGLKILCKYAPSAYVVPVTINNSWKMTRWHTSFPLGIGNTIELLIHQPIQVNKTPFEELFETTQQTIIKDIASFFS